FDRRRTTSTLSSPASRARAAVSSPLASSTTITWSTNAGIVARTRPTRLHSSCAGTTTLIFFPLNISGEASFHVVQFAEHLHALSIDRLLRRGSARRVGAKPRIERRHHPGQHVGARRGEIA